MIPVRLAAALSAASLLSSPLLIAPPQEAAASAAVSSSGVARGNLPSGARYVIETPSDWNGTLLVWSPGYIGGPAGGEAAGGPSGAIHDWLLDEGYALAGSKPTTIGWAVEDLLRDQRDAVDAASKKLGQPEHVIAWGNSMGGLTSAALLEKYPAKFDAGLPMCGSVAGAIPMLNQGLDASFVLKTLLAPNDDRLDLVNVTNESERRAAFQEVLDEAQQTPEGRARISLAASMAQLPTWTQTSDARPNTKDFAAQQLQQYKAFMFAVVSPREPLEARAGGNFSWNTGVDYSRQLNLSGTADLVKALYAESGVNLEDDLAQLKNAPRINADPAAVRYMQTNATPTGDISAPVLTLHESGDTAPTVTQARTYEDRVRSNGNNNLLRQAFVNRPGHCDYTGAEIAAALTTLQQRLDSGTWGNVASPGALNKLAEEIAADTQADLGSAEFAATKPQRMTRAEAEPAAGANHGKDGQL